MQVRHTYIIRIETERDWITLQWLAERGYDAGFLDACALEENDTDAYLVVSMTEPDAWTFSALVNDDPSAFLTCNASDTLNSSLLGFFDSIV